MGSGGGERTHTSGGHGQGLTSNKKKGRFLSSASPIRAGGSGVALEHWCHGTVWRFAAERTHDAYLVLRELLSPLEGELGGSRPYSGECRA
ncbi:unnamed protein product [Discosporangium mesarthrocarpum]